MFQIGFFDHSVTIFFRTFKLCHVCVHTASAKMLTKFCTIYGTTTLTSKWADSTRGCM